MQSKITSAVNPKIKAVDRIRNKGSNESGLTIIEGVKEISMALKAKAKLAEVFVCRDALKDKAVLAQLGRYGCPVHETTAGVFKKISYGDRNEGVLAVCEIAPKGLDTMAKRDKGLYVVIEDVEKPGNLGAIFRSCDAAGVHGVIICDPKAWVYSPNVIRASLGTAFTLDVFSAAKERAVEYFRKNKIRMFATSPQAERTYTQCDLKQSSAIIVGSEHKGLSDFWLKAADEKVRIPMMGSADSLNVSTSTTVLLYEALRQRHPDN